MAGNELKAAAGSLALAMFLLLALASTGCQDSATGRPEEPARTPHSLSQLVPLYDAARFHVIFESGDGDEQFSWIQTPGEQRWDSVMGRDALGV